MSESAFDPAVFLDATVSEANEKRIPLPVENPASPDGFYTAVIGEPEMKGGTGTNKEGKPFNWLQAAVPLKITIPQQLQDSLKYKPEFTLTDRAFIDLTAQGTIDNAPGRNRRQRQYRDATGQNVAGKMWSWRQLQGNVVKIKIEHKVLDDGAIVENISGIFKG